MINPAGLARGDEPNALDIVIVPEPASAGLLLAGLSLLLAGLRRIPLESQIIIELYYWEQLTTKQIAVILGVPHGTARSRLRAARRALEATLGGLARSRERLEATRDNLERWLRSMQARRPSS